ncbi:ABC transporter ATP-binding protein [Arthrobacter sp. ok362]|uniref:ABC transporter ATP-binding protein n=1 Tax=Arthrobacter sp. ok362 TaxID=1761745 RepID=UPI000889C20A|nr:ABC transporter ATP-binding protein [Arthrobacter sp. ok362]SDK60125.1 ABC-type lipoprotein export system, ATPase component [Arthrobacter sp. ok362]
MSTSTGHGSEKSEDHIICEDLVRIFSADEIEVQALQGMNLRVAAGEIVALVGASGSGKSTLLTILSGLDRPTAGVAKVAGVDLMSLKGKRRVEYQRHVVGFIWQQTTRNLLPYLTARENVLLPMAITRRKDRVQRSLDLLHLVGVGHCGDRLPHQMSGGEQQRVAIAVGIANEPKVLLADEPTGELDELTSESVLESLRAVNEQLGVTILIVTHDPSVSEHVRRAVQIRDGRLSMEVLRRTEMNERGHERRVAEEYAVLDKVGRMQLPHDFVRALGLQDKVRVGLEAGYIRISPTVEDEA